VAVVTSTEPRKAEPVSEPVVVPGPRPVPAVEWDVERDFEPTIVLGRE
jgi:hypothetical protein